MAKKAAAAGPVEGPWVLPEGWRWERLGDVADRIADKHKPDPASVLPFVGMDAIAPRSMVVGATQPFGQLRSAASAFEKGDVLYGRLRPYLNKVWCASYAGACSGELIVIRPSADVDARYLAFLLHSDAFVGFASHAVTGDRPRIDFSTMAAFPVPVPPNDVQEGIVARIDELFAEVDDGDAALARARDDLAIWRKALLKAAVTGELTADWRAANPPADDGANLAERILAERAHVASKRLGKRRDKAPDEITPAQRRLLWPAPEGWTWMQLGTFSFVTKLAGFEYTKFVRYDEDGDLRVIKAENAGLHGFKATNYSRLRSSSVAELTRSRLHGGELLMVFVGAGTGNVATVPEGEDFFLGANIGMMRVETDTVSPRFVEMFLRSPVGKALATAAMKAVAQPSLSMGTIRQIPVLLPPQAEQQEILRRVEQALAASADCEIDVRGHQSAAATLRQSILAAAFRGELA